MRRSDVRDLAGALSVRGREAIARRVGVDVRALAAFRITLGLLLLADLLLRSAHLTAFYTDAGVLPRSALRELYPTFARFSIHALSGDARVQIALFLLAGICAASLLVGYRTRPALLVSWILLVSLHARNPFVLNGGDSLLRRLLFWGLFLPLGGRWSIDALRARRSAGDGSSGIAERLEALGALDRSPGRVASAASAGLLCQVVIVYAVNAAFKHRGDLWMRGDAVRYVFSLEQFTVRLGDFVAGYAGLLTVLDWTWMALVSGSVLLILLTGRARALFASLFVGAHLGMALTLKLGLFPFISIAALLPFLPSFAWDALPVPRSPRLTRAIRALDRALPRLPEPSLPPTLARGARRLASVVLASLLVLLIVWNAIGLGYVAMPEDVDPGVDPTQYRWNMFAPEPLGVDGWYVVSGQLASGGEVDVLRASPVRWDRPPSVDRAYPSARWRKYMVDRLWADDNGVLQRYFAAHLCQRWNADHEDRLRELTLTYVEQPTRLDGPEPTRRDEMLTHSCSAGVGGDGGS